MPEVRVISQLPETLWRNWILIPTIVVACAACYYIEKQWLDVPNLTSELIGATVVVVLVQAVQDAREASRWRDVTEAANRRMSAWVQDTVLFTGLHFLRAGEELSWSSESSAILSVADDTREKLSDPAFVDQQREFAQKTKWALVRRVNGDAIRDIALYIDRYAALARPDPAILNLYAIESIRRRGWAEDRTESLTQEDVLIYSRLTGESRALLTALVRGKAWTI